MVNQNITFFGLILLVGLAICDIPAPNAMYREVTMHNTYEKLINYIKSGGHDKFMNSDHFNQNLTPGSNKIGTCEPALEPAPWKFGGFTVASMKYGE